MGYQITYHPVRRLRHLEKIRSSRAALTGFFFLLFLLLTHLFWPDGRKLLQSILIPGDFAVTVSAIEAFSHSLQAGVSFGDGFSDFCRAVLEGAGIVSG